MRAAATPGHKAVIKLLYAKAWGEAAARAPGCDPAVWTLMDNALVVLIRVVPVDAGPEAWAAVAAVMAAAGRLTASLQLNDRALVGLAALRPGYGEWSHGVGLMLCLAAAHKGAVLTPRGDPALVRWYGVMAGMIAGHGGEVNPRLANGVTALHVALHKNGTADAVVALVLLALGADPWEPAGAVPPAATVIHEVAGAEAAAGAGDFRPRAMSALATSVNIFGARAAAVYTLADVVGSEPGLGRRIRALAAMAAMQTPLVVAPAGGRCRCGGAAVATHPGGPLCGRCAARLPSASAAAAARLPLTPMVGAFLRSDAPRPGTELAVAVAILRGRCARPAAAAAVAAAARAGLRLPPELWGLVYGHMLY